MEIKAIVPRSVLIILAYLLVLPPTTIAVELNCDFRNHTTGQYSCIICGRQILKDGKININGFHEEGKNDSNVNFIGFFDSTIHQLSNNVFNKFPNLNELSIQTVKLKIFERESLKGATKLKMFWGKGNDLKKLKADIFAEALNLEEFSFHDNSIRSIDKFAFRNLKKLERMYLGRNGILDLHRDTFSDLIKLKEIHLIDNLIEKLEKGLFRNNPELELVQFYNNRIWIIAPDLFKDLKKKNNINLYKNVCISKTFRKGFTDIKKIDAEIAKCTEHNTLESKNIRLMSELDSSKIKLSVVTKNVEALSHKLEQHLKCAQLENGTKLKSEEILRLQEENNRLTLEVLELNLNSSQIVQNYQEHFTKMSEDILNANQSIMNLEKDLEMSNTKNILLESNSIELLNELNELKTNHSELITENDSFKKSYDDSLELQQSIKSTEISLQKSILGLEKKNLQLSIELHEIKLNNSVLTEKLKVSEELKIKEALENQEIFSKNEETKKLNLEEIKALSNELNELKLQNMDLIEENEQLKSNFTEKMNETLALQQEKISLDKVILETKILQENALAKLQIELKTEKSNCQQLQQEYEEFNLTFAVIESSAKVLKANNYLLNDELEEAKRYQLNLKQNFEKLKLSLENSDNKNVLCQKSLNEAKEYNDVSVNEIIDLRFELEEMNETCSINEESFQKDIDQAKEELLELKEQHSVLNDKYHSAAENSINYQTLMNDCVIEKQTLETKEIDCQLKMFAQTTEFDLEKELTIELRTNNTEIFQKLNELNKDALANQETIEELKITISKMEQDLENCGIYDNN